MAVLQQRLGIILIGHGSVHSDSGKAMVQIAAELREQGLSPVVEAAFLNFSRPSLADAMASCIAQGATHCVIQPYFLIDGQYVSRDLPQLVAAVAADLLPSSDHPESIADPIAVGAPFGDHDALVKLAQKRLLAVEPTPQPGSALLFVAHGTPLAAANEPVHAVAERVGVALGYRCTRLAFLDCNAPSIPDAIAQLVADGYRRLVILPYFLHFGRHIRTDLPAHFADAQRRYPALQLLVAHHLGYDPLLVAITADRVRAAMGASKYQNYSCSHEEL